MMKAMMTTGATIAVILAMPAMAQHEPRVVEKAQVPGPRAERTVTLLKSGKRLETVTCADFIAVDESFYPEAVRYAANYGPKGKAHPTMTVAGVETAVPEVVANCKARPGNHFVQAVHTAMARARKAGK